MSDDLILVDYFGGVFQSGIYVVPGQIRIGSQNFVYRVAARYHTENVADHDPGTANHRFSVADRRIYLDAAHSFSVASLPARALHLAWLGYAAHLELLAIHHRLDDR